MNTRVIMDGKTDGLEYAKAKEKAFKESGMHCLLYDTACCGAGGILGHG